jgi:4-amino-4-deoxy-L-arabinose transferase-like glycosyltransferase
LSFRYNEIKGDFLNFWGKHKREDIFFVAICALIPLIISILFISKHPFIGGDSVSYIDVAKNVAAGRGFVFNWATFDSKELIRPLSEWMPLYPFFIAIFIKAGLDSTFAARLIPLLFLYLIPFSTYFLTRYFYDKRTALVTTIFISLSLPLSIQGSYALTETMFTFFVIMFMLFLSKITEHNPHYYNLIIAGLFGGLAYLTRANGIFLVIVAFIYILFLNPDIYTNKLKKISLFIIGFFASSGIWLARNYAVFGSPFYYGQFGFRVPSLNSFTGVLNLTFVDNLPLIIFLPFILIYANNEIERKKIAYLLLFPIVLLLFFTCWAIQETRLLFPAYPFLLIVSTKSFFGLLEKIKEKFKLRNYFTYISLIIIIFQLLFISQYYNNEKPVNEINGWAEWIKLNTNPNDVIITNCRECVRYYTWRYVVSTDSYALHRDEVKFISPFSTNITKVKYSLNYYKEVYSIAKQGIVHLNDSTLSMAIKNLNANYIVLFRDAIISKEQNGEFIYNLSEGLTTPQNLKIVYNEKNVIIYKINL